jgi:sec-independent protein translocase protein TatA
MEWIIVLVIVLLVFGVGRLSKIGGELGKGIREFRRGIRARPRKRKKKTTSSARLRLDASPQPVHILNRPNGRFCVSRRRPETGSPPRPLCTARRRTEPARPPGNQALPARPAS